MRSARSRWTLEEAHRLVWLAKEGWPVSVISLKVKRTEADVLAKLLDLGLTLPIEP